MRKSRIRFIAGRIGMNGTFAKHALAAAYADGAAEAEDPDFEPGWNFADGAWCYADVSGELHSG